MDDQRRVLERAFDLQALAARQRGANALVLFEVLLAALHVLAHGEPEALDQLVVLHEPRQVLGPVLRRLGREVAEPPVHLDPHGAGELGVARDRVVEQRIEVLPVALEAKDERLVVDACAEKRDLVERNAGELGESTRRVLDRVAEADDAVDRRALVDRPAEHRHGVRVVQQPRLGALAVHVLGDAEHHRDRAQRAEDAADPERVPDRLAQPMPEWDLEVEDRRRVHPDLHHVDDVVRALERGPPLPVRGDRRVRTQRGVRPARDRLARLRAARRGCRAARSPRPRAPGTRGCPRAGSS